MVLECCLFFVVLTRVVKFVFCILAKNIEDIPDKPMFTRVSGCRLMLL